jgi:16S rRNA (cytosine967-C5)-methyltransferase
MGPREAAVEALAGLLATLPALPSLPPSLPATRGRTTPAGTAQPADQQLRDFFRRHPGLGRRDRLQVSDWIFDVLRNLRLYQELALATRTDALPGTGPGAVPGTGRDAVPRTGADAAPGKGADAAPGKGADAVPGSGIDEVAATKRDSPEPRLRAQELIAVAHALANQPSSEAAADYRAGGSAGPSEAASLGALAARLPEAVRYSLPDWLWELLRAAHGGRADAIAAALLRPSPIDLRANLLVGKAEVLRLRLAERGIEAVGIEGVPTGLRVSGRPNLERLDLFEQGWFEVQDAGSQRIVDACGARRGQLVVDFCAGAGGKSLALAARMRNAGKVLAFDTAEERLARLKPRLVRAGAGIVEPVRIDGLGDPRLARYRRRADVVLVDAPCTGTGTLRRSPDLKWRISPERLGAHVVEQQAILAAASALVKPGGTLVYATCSILQEENERQVARFDRPGFRLDGSAAWLPDEGPSSSFFLAKWLLQARK